MMGDQSYTLEGQFSGNPYFKSNSAFSPTAFGGMFLTSRLDGYSVSDVTNALDRAQQAYIGPNNSSTGPYWFLVDNVPTITYAPPMANLVNNVLTPAGLPVVYDNTSAFVGSAPGPVIGFDSHGSHQASTPTNLLTGGLSVTLANGAVFNSWDSYNAYSFTPGGYSGTQPQVAQWLAMGGTVGVGNVAEPGASQASMCNEDQLFKMLLSGRTWAEAAWSSFTQLSYVNTVVGDPLMTWMPKVAIAGPTSTLRGQTQTYTLSASAYTASSMDNFTYTINWGDGSPVQTVSDVATTKATHIFNSLGTWTISVTATDASGRVSLAATQSVTIAAWQLVANAQNPGLMDLVWSGTSGDDRVSIQQISPTAVRITETLLNGTAVQNVQNLLGVTGRVRALGNAGNDTLDAGGLQTTKATLDGGAGNNTILGGQAGDILIGGSNGAEGAQGSNTIIAGNGDNTIYGNDVVGLRGMTGGNNLILGGTGNDTIYGAFGSVVTPSGQPCNGGEGGSNLIVGGGGKDLIYASQAVDGGEGGHGSILISGPTTLNQAALQTILNEWASSNTYAVRVANISGTGLTSGLNGTNYLIAGNTVLDDKAVDELVSDTNGAADWFFYNLSQDVVDRLKLTDTSTDTSK